jgi:prephenate dehydrogenase
MSIARGLFSEDDYLLTEILFNPFTSGQVENIRKELKDLLALIDSKDTVKLQEYLKRLRKNIE